jgi:hypothetical protein
MCLEFSIVAHSRSDEMRSKPFARTREAREFIVSSTRYCNVMVHSKLQVSSTEGARGCCLSALDCLDSIMSLGVIGREGFQGMNNVY